MAVRRDVVFQLFYGGSWHTIPRLDTRNELASDGGASIVYGRQDETSQAQQSTVGFSINNPHGMYSARNALSPLYGLIGQNTPGLIILGESPPGGTNGSVPTSTSHVAPSVDPLTDDGLMISTWLAGGVVNYTVPGSMTAESETDGPNFSTMASASEAIASTAPTGTRTATVSGLGTASATLSIVVPGTGITIAEVLSDVTTTIDAGVTTDASTMAGQVALVIAGLDFDAADNMATSPGGDIEGWLPILDGDIVTAGSGFYHLHLKAWIAPILADGAKEITFPGSPGSEVHLHVFILDDAVEPTIRFSGEIPAWPVRWHPAETDVWVPLEMSDVIRRMSQGTPRILSAPYRFITTSNVDGVPNAITYWAMTDGPSSQSALVTFGSGSEFRRFAGRAPRWGSVELASHLESVVDIAGSVISAGTGFDTYADTEDGWAVDTAYLRNEGGISFSPYVFGTLVESGGANRRDWAIQDNPGAGQLLVVTRSVADDGSFASTTLATINTTLPFDGNVHHLRLQVEENTATTSDWALFLDGLEIASGTGVAAVPTAVSGLSYGSSTATSDEVYAIGHVVVWGAGRAIPPVLSASAALFGWPGEPAGVRFRRVCLEIGVDGELIGDAENTVLMGPEPVADPLSILRDVEAVDHGMLNPNRNRIGLIYRTLGTIVNQDAAITLDYAARQISPELQPTDDDQRTRNRVTATRPEGGSVTVSKDVGPLSTLDPPQGAGVYGEGVQVNVAADHQLLDQAGWLVALGTWDEARYPTLTVDMMDIVIATTPGLFDALMHIRPGDRLDLVNLPSWLPTPTVRLLYLGYSEELGRAVHTVVSNQAPYGPYAVGSTEEPGVTPGPDEAKRYDIDTCRVLSNFDAGVDTALAVSLGTSLGRPWSTSASVPFDIRVRPVNVGGSGVHLRVTAVSAAGAGTQTLTVQQAPLNGVVREIPFGWVVELLNPIVYAPSGVASESAFVQAGRVPGQQLALAEQTDDSDPFTTTETEMMRVTAALHAGRTYRIAADVAFRSSVANDRLFVGIRLNRMDGDFVHAGGNLFLHSTASGGFPIFIEVEFTPTIAGVYSFLLTGDRVGGTGDCRMEAAATRPARMFVEYVRG